MKRLLTICALGVALGQVGCAGQTVEPIDIHNPIISADSRRFVADAQDAVSIARNGVNEEERQLSEAKGRRKTLLKSEAWEDIPKQTKQAFQKLLDARVQLATLRLEAAEAELALAEAKLTEVYAETAVRHDLETYDLAPVQKQVDKRIARLRAAKRKAGDYLLELDKVSRAWWKTYRNLLDSNKHPDVFFATALKQPESPFQIERPKDDGDKKASKKPKK